MAPQSPATARRLLQKVGLEMAFLDPAAAGGGAAGTMLISLLTELLTACDSAPEVIRGLIAQARDGTTMAVTGSPAALAGCVDWLAGWHAWMEDAVTAWDLGQPLPEVPPAVAAGPAAAAAPGPAASTPAASTPAAPGPAASTPAGVAPAPRRLDCTDPAGCQDVSVLPAQADPELVRLFCEDAQDLLRGIEQGVLVLEKNPGDPDTLATVFRAFHTFKGNAGILKLAAVQRLAHDVESLLDAARRGDRVLDREAIDVILAAADAFDRFVAEMARQVEGSGAGRSLSLPVPAILAAVATILASPPGSPHGPVPAVPVPAVPVPAVPVPAVPVPAVPVPAVPVPAVPVPAVPVPAVPVPAAAAAGASIRVDTQKLDGLIDLVGELVIAQSMVVQGTQADEPTDDHLARALGRLRGITSDLQRTAMSLRMVPIRGTFQKMTRLVRDAAAELGKDVKLVLDGEETELDRTVIEQIGDPLVHMIRNAIDHGIEPPAVRAAAGKPRAGTIRLSAFHQGGFVVVRIADDGRGLDPARIRAKALERGLLGVDAVLDDRDTLELIFAAGFSTAEQVTGLSGRGVGMDVVRRNIEGIRGKIEIESTVGGGTTFTIFMPLTLAIIEGLIVAVGEQRFVVPTLSVRESLRPLPADVSTVQGRGELVNVRGRLVPLLRLGPHVGAVTRATTPADGIVVVVEAGQECRGLLVDDLLGKQEVVIKSLGETFAGRRGFAGAAILGDGRVGLILDTNALVRLRPAAAGSAA
jgi:two-component system, chemotaxis family, sensor kinase CheA